MISSLQLEGEEFLAQMRERDRERAAVSWRKEGVQVLSDYERDLLGLPSREEEERARRAREKAAREHRERVAAVVRPKDIIFRTPLLERLNAHVIDLLVLHRIEAKRSPDAGGRAYHETRTIAIPPVTNEANYIVALHEIGHLISLEADSRQFRYVIDKKRQAMVSQDGEIGADRFAVATAVVYTREMHDRLCDGLDVYAQLGTKDERDRVAAFFSWGALNIADRPWTFEELETRCKNVRRDREAPTLQTAALIANQVSR